MQKLYSEGVAVMSVDYDPFGNIIEGILIGEYGFSAKPLVKGLNWYYYGYRYYDAETGRWSNRDPISELGSRLLDGNGQAIFSFAEIENPYRFVSNAPISTVDIDGRSTLTKIIDVVTLGTLCIPGSTGTIEKEGNCTQTCTCGQKNEHLQDKAIAAKRWRCRNGIKKFDPGFTMVVECPVRNKCKELKGSNWKNGRYRFSVIFHPF
jgi:RHS repeat-associated protein